MPTRPFAEHTQAEKEEQRDRYRELLEEIRTVLPGVQVLFAFLLTATFSQRFTDLDLLGVRVFAGALLATALSAITLMSPAALHRVGARKDRAERLAISIALQVVGMFLLLTSMSMAVFVVARFMFSDTSVGFGFGVAAALVGLILWYAVPVLTRQRDG